MMNFLGWASFVFRNWFCLWRRKHRDSDGCLPRRRWIGSAQRICSYNYALWCEQGFRLLCCLHFLCLFVISLLLCWFFHRPRFYMSNTVAFILPWNRWILANAAGSPTHPQRQSSSQRQGRWRDHLTGFCASLWSAWNSPQIRTALNRLENLSSKIHFGRQYFCINNDIFCVITAHINDFSAHAFSIRSANVNIKPKPAIHTAYRSIFL